jgi:hypothetical protein
MLWIEKDRSENACGSSWASKSHPGAAKDADEYSSSSAVFEGTGLPGHFPQEQAAGTARRQSNPGSLPFPFP